MHNHGDATTRNDGPTRELISTSWEPCPNFTAEAAASPVCSGCGWLAVEHDPSLPLAS